MNRVLENICRIIPDKYYISLLFYKKFGRKVNLKAPKTFNEKLQWLKLHDHNPIYTTFVDKFLVKKYVSDIIGEEYIIPTLGHWDDPKDIDFDSLPNQFVLKWNHDSGSVIICKDKSVFNVDKVIKKLKHGKNRSGYWYGREWPYKDVVPCIIAEPYMESKDDDQKFGLIDYKFYCFNGKPEYLYVSRGLGLAHDKAEVSFYTLEWEKAPFGRIDFNELSIVPKKPVNFEKMIETAELLSKNMDFLRVDFYEINGKMYFSELTLYPCSGLMKFSLDRYDLELGNKLKLTV